MGVKSVIVGVTACGSKAEKEAFMNAGLDHCWEKPLNVARISSLLDELVPKML